MSKHQGSCHCGRVKFEVDTDLEMTARCNCSLCRRKGAIMSMVDADDFKLLSGDDDLAVYQYHTKVAKHYFCKHCGIYTHHRPRRFPEKYGFNVGCLDDVDTFALEPKVLDGASLD